MTRLSLGRALRRLAPGVTIGLSLTVTAACGPFHHVESQEPASIIFTNDALDQATVYVVGPGYDFRRIGTVFAGRTDTLTVPASFVIRGPMNIVARLLAHSELPQTGPVQLSPGGMYQVTLPPNSRLISFLPH